MSSSSSSSSFDASIFGYVGILTFGIQLCGFLVAYALQTEIFYDILGGINFLLVAILGIIHKQETATSPPSTRFIVMTAIFATSRGWLLSFLAYRAHSRKGDSRFDGVKDKFGQFFIYWLAQAFWVFIISWPLIYVQSVDSPTPTNENHKSLSICDSVTTIGFGIGAITEILADIQKTVWVNNGRQGTFCTVGLWNYSRHPNYFGEIFQWWCAWLLSYGSLTDTLSSSSSTSSSSETMSIIFFTLGCLSPLFTMNILLNMQPTGIWNAEGKNLSRYYDSEDGEAYKEYRASTSILIPMIGYKHIPLWIKRTFLFEWERFDYKPTSGNNRSSSSSSSNNKKNE